LKETTEKNIASAFAGESQAHMKYVIFADKAEEEGYPNLARLFRAIAFAERVHARNHYDVLGNIRESAKNLQVAIDGETYEVQEMYPAFKSAAELQGEKGAQRSTDWALQAEKIHVGMYQRAKQAVERKKDVDASPIQVCEVCGYTVDGKAPERCPMCGAPREKFRSFE
jgi:rubrerythrin